MELRCKISNKHGSCVKLGGTFDAPVNIQAQVDIPDVVYIWSFASFMQRASLLAALTHNNEGVVRCSEIVGSGVVLRVEQVFSGQCQTVKGFIPQSV